MQANRGILGRLGVRDVHYTQTKAESGVEIGDDGVLRIHAPKLARSMEAVRDLQAQKGLPSTPDDWMRQVMIHEGIHAADGGCGKKQGTDAAAALR